MRIIALPLARVKISSHLKLKSSDSNANTLLVFYHFDLVSRCGGLKDLPWHQKVLHSVINKATNIWSCLGKAPKGSWKLWTYELGERVTNRVEFEEIALRNIDPSLGPTVPATGANARGIDDDKDVRSRSHSTLAKIPLIYPPSLFSVGADRPSNPPLVHLQTILMSHGPQHWRGFYLWMLIAPLTLPIALIPAIPNFPFFFCVWRSWSHYRAYRSSQYLSSLLDLGLIEPKASLELDRLYASFTSPRSSENTSTFGDIVPDRKLVATSGTETSFEGMLLTRGEMPQIVEMFCFPESTRTDIQRAMNQAHVRLGKSP